MRRALLFAILVCPLTLLASNWFVRPTATGSKTGSDWNNAWALNTIQWSSVHGGDTVWIAGGSYSDSLTPGTSGSSSGVVTIKRAQSSDSTAAAAPGWSSAFDSVAKIGGISVPSGSFITIDGGARNGIQINLTTSGGACINGATSGNIDHITFNNIACVGPYTSGTVVGGGLWGINLAPSNNTVSNVLIHGCSIVGMGESLRASNWSNVTIEYCYLADTSANSQEHEDVMYSYPSNNVTFRYNLINNSPNDGIFMEYGGANNFSFYGNVYYNSQFWFICTKAGSGSAYGPLYVYNNVFMSQGTQGAWVSTNGANMTGNSLVYNNIFWNVSNDMRGAGVTSDYNAYNYTSIGGASWNSGEAHSFTFTTNPFVKMPGNLEPVGAVVSPWGTDGDFHLTSSAEQQFANGLPLASDGFLNKDLSGNTRGNTSWTIGAYQAGNAGPTPAPTATPVSPHTPTPTPTPAGKFAIGSTIGAALDVNVRSTAAGTWVGVQSAGSGVTGVIIDGPQIVTFNGVPVIWWNVTFSSGPSGWVGQDNLVQVVATPTPSPTPTPHPTYNAWEKTMNKKIATGQTPSQLLQWINSHPPTSD